MWHKIARLFQKARVFRNTKQTSNVDRRKLPEGVKACSVIIRNQEHGEKVKYVPIGVFPVHPDGAHELTQEKLQEMVDNLESDVMVDLGHEALWHPGAPAYGWIMKDSLEVREDGLYGDYPEFTPDAEELVQNRKYRFLSPAYELETQDKQGRDRGARLWPISLTNTPYFDAEIDALRNSQTKEEPEMKYTKEFKEELGLKEDATDDEVKAKLDKINGIVEDAIKVKDEDPDKEKDDDKDKDNDPENTEETDEATVAANSALLKRLEALEQREKEQEEQQKKNAAEQLVEQAVAQWKIRPAQKQVYLNSALHDYDATKKELDGIKPGAAKPGGVHVNSQTEAEDDEERKKLSRQSAVKNAVDFMKGQGRAYKGQETAQA